MFAKSAIPDKFPATVIIFVALALTAFMLLELE